MEYLLEVDSQIRRGLCCPAVKKRGGSSFWTKGESGAGKSVTGFALISAGATFPGVPDSLLRKRLEQSVRPIL